MFYTEFDMIQILQLANTTKSAVSLSSYDSRWTDEYHWTFSSSSQLIFFLFFKCEAVGKHTKWIMLIYLDDGTVIPRWENMFYKLKFGDCVWHIRSMWGHYLVTRGKVDLYKKCITYFLGIFIIIHYVTAILYRIHATD